MTYELAEAGGVPRLVLRLEGTAAGIAGIWLYANTGQSWWLFVILFLAPDIAFAAYLAGPRIGAIAYNALHSTIGPLALAALGLVSHSDLTLALGAIWLAHVGFDRLFGYGLKYATSFQDTHLGRIGKK